MRVRIGDTQVVCGGRETIEINFDASTMKELRNRVKYFAQLFRSPPYLAVSGRVVDEAGHVFPHLEAQPIKTIRGSLMIVEVGDGVVGAVDPAKQPIDYKGDHRYMLTNNPLTQFHRPVTVLR